MRLYSMLALGCACLFPAVVTGGSEPTTRVVVCSLYQKPDQPLSASPYGVTRADFHLIKQAFPGTAALRGLVSEARHRNRLESTVVIGCTANVAAIAPISIKQGRFLTPRDETQAENVCVISEHLATRLFANKNAVGKNVRLLNGYYLVVGVCKTPESAVCGSHLRSVYGRVKYDALMYIPWKAMQARMGDTHVMRASGALEIQRFELSELWIPGDKDRVEAILRSNRRDPRKRAADVDLSDLFITRRVFGASSSRPSN